MKLYTCSSLTLCGHNYITALRLTIVRVRQKKTICSMRIFFVEKKTFCKNHILETLFFFCVGYCFYFCDWAIITKPKIILITVNESVCIDFITYMTFACKFHWYRFVKLHQVNITPCEYSLVIDIFAKILPRQNQPRLK